MALDVHVTLADELVEIRRQIAKDGRVVRIFREAFELDDPLERDHRRHQSDAGAAEFLDHIGVEARRRAAAHVLEGVPGVHAGVEQHAHVLVGVDVRRDVLPGLVGLRHDELDDLRTKLR